MATPEAVPQTTSCETDWSARRSDARRNYERIVVAAREVFSERGLAATVPEVAARAGVGKATVYRCYPTKDDLVAAVMRHHIEWLEQRFSDAEAESGPDPRGALDAALGDIFERLADDRVLVDALGQGVISAPGLSPDTMGRIADMMERAKADGEIRADATLQDLTVLLGGCARQLARLDEHDPAAWRRYGGIVMNALRP
jgi:AcrR family transcriptional regulator